MPQVPSNPDASSYITPMMQNLASIQGSNQATDYMRLKDEIATQQRILDAQRKKQNSFGQRMLRGVTGAVPGLLMGAITGNPFAALGGAAAGFAGGALAPAGTDTAALGVLGAGMANGGSSYLSGSVNNTDIPNSQAPGTSSMPVGQPGGLSVGIDPEMVNYYRNSYAGPF